MTKILTLLVVLALASPAFAQDSRLLHGAIGAAMVAHAADISTTMFAKGKYGDRFREANPVLRPFAGDPVTFAVAKMGLAVGANYVLLKIHKTRPKTALAIAVAQVGLMGYVAHHNAQQAGLR